MRRRLATLTPCLAAVIFCLFQLVPPVHAAAPGDVLEDLQADAFNTNCAAGDLSCDTSSDLGTSTGFIQVSTSDGLIVRYATLSSGFSVDGDDGGAPLIGSLLAANVVADGVLEATEEFGVALYRLDLSVYDETDGEIVATSKVVSDGTVGGLTFIEAAETVVLPLSLRPGHDYTVSLTLTATVESTGGKAAADFMLPDNSFGWNDLTIRIGRDLGGELADLVDRIEDLEMINKRLIAALKDLREDFEGHSHVYLTGKGQGHNNTRATTSQPKEDGPEVTPHPRDLEKKKGKKKSKKKGKKKRW